MDYSPLGSSVNGISQARINRVGCHFLLQGIFPTQRWNLCLLLGRQILYYGASWEAPQWQVGVELAHSPLPSVLD